MKLSHTTFLIGLVLLPLFWTACSSSKRMVHSREALMEKQIDKSPVFKTSFTGFILMDPVDGRIIYKYNADKYFVPASNTKVLTFYLANQLLGDSIAALRYMIQGDKLIFWGTGDPAFLNPAYPKNETVLKFLHDRGESLWFCPSNFSEAHFGSGWMWDDYLHYFQAEKSPFPIYGNVVQFKRAADEEYIEVSPGYFQGYTKLNADLGGTAPRIYRPEIGNDFAYNPKALTGAPFDKKVPFDYSAQLFVKLLSDTLGKQVNLLKINLLPPEDTEVLYSRKADELYRKLLRDSDNFTAEQLLLLCADRQLGVLHTGKILEFAQDSLLKGLPQRVLWRDASGLSRYNKITPLTMAALLQRIYKNNSWSRIQSLFPVGGQSGTIEADYTGNPPFVTAKTGTMSHIYNLSGFLQTHANRTLVFSFMNNNYTGDPKTLKLEIEKILNFIREQY